MKKINLIALILLGILFLGLASVDAAIIKHARPEAAVKQRIRQTTKSIQTNNRPAALKKLESPSRNVLPRQITRGFSKNSPAAVDGSKTEETKIENPNSPLTPFLDQLAAIRLAAMTTEAQWIITAQAPSGAFKMTPNSSEINPYFANLAGCGLAEAGSAFEEPIKKYILWYLAHFNRQPDDLGVRGTIYDYRIVNGQEVPTKDVVAGAKNYDSSDSYAATFLSVVSAYYQISGDTIFIKNYLADFKLIASAIDATMQPIGLTFAKVNYPEAYLMDNVEVWRGYYDFAVLSQKIGNIADAQVYSAKANGVANAIETLLWDKEKQQYRPSFGSEMDWDVFYPDASANLWPVIFDLPVAADRTQILYQKFINHHPAWIINQTDEFPWTSLAIAAIKAKDYETVLKYYQNLKQNFLVTRAWPWYIGEAGWLIRSLASVAN